jgi:octaprenyl-diphosphate synthase
MSEGELLQIEKARRLDIDEEVYYEIIRQKTATLIGSCCAVGAASAGNDDAGVERMRKFGQLIGIAFQIKDDLFDFDLNNRTGKPSAIDIKESKMTLPLIYALARSDRSEKKAIISIIRNHNTDGKYVKQVLDFVEGRGGIAYANQKMTEYSNAAIGMLDTFTDGPYRESLINLIRFTTEREN